MNVPCQMLHTLNYYELVKDYDNKGANIKFLEKSIKSGNKSIEQIQMTNHEHFNQNDVTCLLPLEVYSLSVVVDRPLVSNPGLSYENNVKHYLLNARLHVRFLQEIGFGSGLPVGK